MSDEVVLKINTLNPAEFFKQIDAIVKEYNVSYMDAVISHCESNNVEIETAAALIKANLKFKTTIQLEAEVLNFLPRAAHLPI